MPQYLTGMRKQNTTIKPKSTNPSSSSGYTGYTDVGGNNVITPSATMLGGGRAASQANQVQSILSAQQASQNAQNQAIANAMALAQRNAARSITPDAPAEAPKDVPVDINVNNGDGGGGSGSGSGSGSGYGGYQSAPANDPYASIYSIYEQQLNATRDALAQQKQARINALQANYNNAKNQLDSSFASGEASLNQNADDALREAWVESKLNQRAMQQYLASQGITGGAAESIIANLYNTYGNNRNSIEKGRANDLRDLLANYQGTLGNIENSYLSGLADTDSDYSGAISNALQSYYSNLADLQKQNIANQYKTALSKGGSTTSADNLNSTIMSGLKNHKGNLSAARAYLSVMGVPEEDQDLYLWNAGFDLTPEGQAQAQAEAYEDALGSIDYNIQNKIVNDLKRVYPTSARDGLSANDSLYANVINLLNQYARQYGLTDAQAQALLKEAGF